MIPEGVVLPFETEDIHQLFLDFSGGCLICVYSKNWVYRLLEFFASQHSTKGASQATRSCGWADSDTG
jgi:hypothetical protein